MEKFQKWRDTYPSTQSPFQKKNFGKLHKKHISKFLNLSSSACFLDIVSLILSAIVEYALIISENA